jgi:hypothetical protein
LRCSGHIAVALLHEISHAIVERRALRPAAPRLRRRSLGDMQRMSSGNSSSFTDDSVLHCFPRPPAGRRRPYRVGSLAPWRFRPCIAISGSDRGGRPAVLSAALLDPLALLARPRGMTVR